MNFAFPAQTKINAEYEYDGDTNCKKSAWKDFQKLLKENESIRNHRKNRLHPNHDNVQIGRLWCNG